MSEKIEVWKKETQFSDLCVFSNQLGYFPNSQKKATTCEKASSFEVKDLSGKVVFSGAPSHYGTDSLSGDDSYVCDFSALTTPGEYYLEINAKKTPAFSIGTGVYDTLMKDMWKTYYFLRCGMDLDEKYAGPYAHKACHTTPAKVFGHEEIQIDCNGGWHDAGDYGKYMTAGACAVAHLLYAVRLYPELKNLSFDIPKETLGKSELPDVLSEVKYELDFLKKLQLEDGSTYHKVTTMRFADFIMPEEDKADLFLFPVSSIATADFAAMEALAYTVYKEYDESYANDCLERAKKAFEWLDKNPEPLLFNNPPGCQTGVYGEWEDNTNRFWAACALYEATKDEKYLANTLKYKKAIEEFEEKQRGNKFIEGISGGSAFTNMGYAGIAGLGSISYILSGREDDLGAELKDLLVKEAERLAAVSKENGYDACMLETDFVWGSNMVIGKYGMVYALANLITGTDKYKENILDVFHYLLGRNPVGMSYISGEGKISLKNPHLRPTEVDGIENPWPGLVSGGPNRFLQDEIAGSLLERGKTPPMKCYLDHAFCYSLNEITIYWNSPVIFALAAILYN